MARVINAQHATLIGTPERLRELLTLLRGRTGAAVVDLRFSNIVVLDRPLDGEQFRDAIATTPRSG